MNYLTIKYTLKNWGVTDRMVVCLYSAGWIREVKKLGNTCLIPVDTEKPADGQDRRIQRKEG